jgi:DNA gyrase subunit A
VLVTAQGKAIRFAEDGVRPMGRTAGGVNAIRLGDKDQVAAADLARPGAEVVMVTERGHAKRTPLDEYTVQGRGGSGLLTLDAGKLARSGPIVAMRVLLAGDELLLTTAEGAILRLPASKIASAGRAGRASPLLKLKASDRVAAVALLSDVPVEDSPPPVPEGGAAPEPEGPPRPPRGKGAATKGKATARAGAGRGASGAKETARRGKAAPAKAAAEKAAEELAPKGRRSDSNRAGTAAPKGRTGKAPEEPAAKQSTKATGRKTGGSAGGATAKATGKKSVAKATARQRTMGEEAGTKATRPRQGGPPDAEDKLAARGRRAKKPADAD